MPQWMQTNNTSTRQPQASNCGSNVVGNMGIENTNKGENCTANGLKVLRLVQGPGEIKTKTFEVMNECLRSSSENLRQEGSEFQDSKVSPASGWSNNLVKFVQGTDDMLSLEPVAIHNFNLGKVVDCKTVIQSSPVLRGIPVWNEISEERNYCYEGTSKNLPHWIQTHVSEKDYTAAALKTLRGSFIKSSSYAVPHSLEHENFEFDEGKTSPLSAISKGKTSAPAAFRRSAQISNSQLSNLRMQVRKYHYDNRQSVNLVCEGNVDSYCQPKNSLTSCFMENDASMLFDPASTSTYHLSKIGREMLQKTPNSSGFRLFPRLIASEKTEVKKSLYDGYSVQKVEKCMHNVETMRICTTVDSEAEPGGCPRLCQAPHRLLITKKTDVSLSKENDICRSSMATGSTPSDLYKPSPLYDQGKQGMKLPSPCSFTDSEGKRDIDFVKASKVTVKNESSAETGIIDIHSFKRKNPECGANYALSNKVPFTVAGANSALSNKDITRHWSSQNVVTFSQEAGCPRPNTELTDINLNLPALPAAVTFSEKEGPLSSRTQSLDVDTLLTHAEMLKQQSDRRPDGSLIADPSDRWVKRLKLSSSRSSAQGTKSSNMAKYLCHDKMNRFLTRILNSGVAAETAVMKPHGKEFMAWNRGRLLNEDENFSRIPTNEGEDLLLSDAWIKRWLRNGSCIVKNEPDPPMFYEPQSSNMAMEDLQKKQFPSIAAMALMGKATSGFQPCELQKKGSFIVWNTKAF